MKMTFHLLKKSLDYNIPYVYSGVTGGHKKPPTGGEEYISDTVMVACVVLERALFIVHYLHHTLCKAKMGEKKSKIKNQMQLASFKQENVHRKQLNNSSN